MISTQYLLINIFIVADLVNQGISMAKKMHTAYTIRLSINKDLKLKKKKRKDKQQRKRLYIII